MIIVGIYLYIHDSRKDDDLTIEAILFIVIANIFFAWMIVPMFAYKMIQGKIILKQYKEDNDES
ncbi:MAG: hypothetical protein GY861_05705 [bacterium]|nr:hypothetical protein [bacterium]